VSLPGMLPRMNQSSLKTDSRRLRSITKDSVEGMRMKQKLVESTVVVTILVATLLLIHPIPAQSAPRRIEVTAKRFAFTPSEITLKKGEPVVLVLTSVDVPHGIRFKELDIETKAGKGQSSELSFTPATTGTFVGHCAVFCGSGHGMMTLTLHVVE
jgi:cytochrome c oxidase subunit 2